MNIRAHIQTPLLMKPPQVINLTMVMITLLTLLDSFALGVDNFGDFPNSSSPTHSFLMIINFHTSTLELNNNKFMIYNDT